MKKFDFVLWFVMVMALTGGHAHAQTTLALELIDRIPVSLVGAVSAPGDDSWLFLVGLQGSIHILDLTSDTILPEPFLSIPVTTSGERGLLGLAFHPDYAINGFFYVYYSDSNLLVNRLTRYSISENPNIADPTSEVHLLSIPSSERHNAGWIGFGPDGFMYMAIGDGGHGGTAGLLDNLRGKILRIDVDGDDFPDDPERNYTIPSINPFVGINGEDEIFVHGLRNPWRCSFDRVTGDLYIGDVGDRWEEINVIANGSPGGFFLGWPCAEGKHVVPGCSPFPIVDPVFATGGVVIGGYVYRGCAMPDLYGTYFFGDLSRGPAVSFRYDGSSVNELHDFTAELTPTTPGTHSLFGFGEDFSGELYALFGTGHVYRIIPAPGQIAGCCEIASSDITHDGRVDLDDLQLVLFGFGTTTHLGDLINVLSVFGSTCHLP